MASLVSQLIVRLVDEVTDPIRRISQNIRRLPDSLDRATQANAERMNQLRGQMVDAIGVGYALVRGLRAPIDSAGQFQAAMNRVGAALEETDQEFDALRLIALEMGRTTSFTAIESADAIEVLAKNGLTASEILGGALHASLLLASSSGAELAHAGDIATDVMFQFGKRADEMNEVVDGITGVLLASKFGIDDYRLALAQAGGVAGGLGVEFEDFNAAIAATSSLFASGSDAGTSFKTFLQRLVPQTAGAEGHMKALGLEFFDAAGNMKSISEIAQELQDGFAGLSEEAKNEALKEIFGTDAMRTAVGLMEQGADGVDRIRETIDRASATEQAEARLKGFEGELTKMSSAVEGLSIAIGTALLPPLTNMVQAIAKVVVPLTELATKYPDVTRVVIAAAVGLVAFRVATIGAAYAGKFMQGALIGLVRPLVGATWGILRLLNPLRLVTNAIRVLKLALIGSGIGAILVGIGLAGAFIYQNWEGISAAFDSFKVAFDAALGPAQATLEPVIQAMKDLWSWVETITGPLPIESWTEFGAALGTIAGEAVVKVSEIASEIARLGEAFAADPAGFMRDLYDGLLASVASVDWSALAASIGSAIGSGLGTAAGVGGEFIASLYTQITESLATVDWSTVGGMVARGILDLAAGAAAFAADAAAWMASLASSFSTSAGTTDWSAVGTAIVNGILAIGNAGAQFVAGFWAEVQTAWAEVDWSSLGLAIGKGILDGLAAIGSRIVGYLRDLLLSAVPDFMRGWFGADEVAAAAAPAAAAATALGGESGEISVDTRSAVQGLDRVGDAADATESRLQMHGAVAVETSELDALEAQLDRVHQKLAALGDATGRRAAQLRAQQRSLEAELARSRATNLEDRPY